MSVPVTAPGASAASLTISSAAMATSASTHRCVHGCEHVPLGPITTTARNVAILDAPTQLRRRRWLCISRRLEADVDIAGVVDRVLPDIGRLDAKDRDPDEAAPAALHDLPRQYEHLASMKGGGESSPRAFSVSPTAPLSPSRAAHAGVARSRNQRSARGSLTIPVPLCPRASHRGSRPCRLLYRPYS